MSGALGLRWCAAAALLALSGCGGPGAPRAAARPAPPDEQPRVHSIVDAEACAHRLHTISGGLLFYFAMEQALPARLEDLRGMPGMGEVESFTCPASDLPYIYNPRGIPIPEQDSRIVLFDGAPSHGTMRWAVMIEEPRAGEPLVTKVIALPESFFLLHQHELHPRATIR